MYGLPMFHQNGLRIRKTFSIDKEHNISEAWLFTQPSRRVRRCRQQQETAVFTPKFLVRQLVSKEPIQTQRIKKTSLAASSSKRSESDRSSATRIILTGKRSPLFLDVGTSFQISCSSFYMPYTSRSTSRCIPVCARTCW